MSRMYRPDCTAEANTGKLLVESRWRTLGDHDLYKTRSWKFRKSQSRIKKFYAPGRWQVIGGVRTATTQAVSAARLTRLAGPGSVFSALLDANDHGVRADEMLDASFAEANFFHPGDAILARIVETAGRFNQHVQTHHQAEGILRAIIVND
jgi:hypothetical protein